MKEILKDVVKRLQDRNLTVVSENTGISYNTLKNIRDGINTNPTINTLETISNYLRG